MKKSHYTYKVVDNERTVEVFKFQQPKPMEIEETETGEQRKGKGNKRRSHFIIPKGDLEYYELEKEEIEKRYADKYASLEEKLEKNAITREQYNENKQIALKRSKNRALTKFNRLFQCNVNHQDYGEVSKFITLTYKENVQDRERAISDFKVFIKKLNYYHNQRQGITNLKELKKYNLQWLCTMETQKRGAWHFHLVIFNLPFTKHRELKKLWEYGSVNVKAIGGTGKDDIETDKVMFYLSKYMFKEQMIDFEETLLSGKITEHKGKKNYLSSRGLKKPKEKLLAGNEELELKQYLNELTLSQEKEFYNEYQGLIHHTIFLRKKE